MLKKNNKEKTIKEFENDKGEMAFNIIPNVSDKVLDYMEEKFIITKIIEDSFETRKKYNTDINNNLIILSGVQSRMKQQFSISEMGLALTSKNIINNIGFNLSYSPKDSLLKESNTRAWLEKFEQEEIKELTKDVRKTGKVVIDSQILKFNNYFIEYTNKLNGILMEKANLYCNIHIFDCSILDVNLDNKFYEGSTTTYKNGKKLRGYKTGILRGILPDGGFIEEINMDTAKVHDLEMSRDFLLKSKHLKKGDHLLMDRGFLDISFFRDLIRKCIFIIIPVKKNMEIYEEAVRQAKQLNEKDWVKHPNEDREGQSIALIKSLEMAWLPSNEKNKKPDKIKLDYAINGCVIRFDIAKNKDVLSDEEIISTDGKYAYACIITNDISLDCNDIIRMYEMRSEIEEDFRQLKDFWGLNMYKSTKYHIISFIIMVSLIAYNFYQIYINSDEGKEYIGKNFIVQERHGLYITKNVRTAIVTEHYFGIFELDELLDIYTEFSIKHRKTLKEFLAE